MESDPDKSIKSVENSLRELISLVLSEKFGKDDWIEKSGVSQEKIERWKERKETEKKRQKSGTADKRLIYYADFYDLKKIIEKNWNDFSEILKNKKEIEVFLTVLERYRDPNAHNRELFSYQKNLISGITGEIQSMITKYHSKKQTGEDCFPRIESVSDNLGNFYPNEELGYGRPLGTLKPGDELEFIVTAVDPEGLELEYGILGSDRLVWQKSNILNYKITENDIGKDFSILIYIRSSRKYHAFSEHDARVLFAYLVLPNE